MGDQSFTELTPSVAASATALAEVDSVGAAHEGFGNREKAASRLFSEFVPLEMSRVDPSFSTLFGVNAGVAFWRASPTPGRRRGSERWRRGWPT